jgi:PAS domain S-box-containing protein/putative nucleotidyltransferase with HDIG domain
MAQSDPMRILYVEDDPGLARLVQKRLGKVGYTVDIASDGEEGLAKYQANSYDLLFVDQSLPVHDGLEVIRILGSNGSLPPTVMITGTGDERVAVEAMKLGAGDYIVKDVEGGYLELLPSVVEKVLQQRRAVEEKQRAEEAYRAVAEHSLQGLHILQEGREVFVNSVYAKMLGYTEEELLALTPAQVRHLVHPEDRERVGKHYRDRLKGKSPPQHYEFRIIRKDGSMRWVETFASRIEYQGRPASQLAMIDITERKQAEGLLRESEEKYRSLVERANDGITIIQDGIAKYVNPRLAEMWGGTVQMLVETPFTDYIDPDELPKVLGRYNRRMKGEDVSSTYETVLRRKDGGKVYAELNAGAITYQGKLADLVFVRDITERKRAEDILRHSEERYRTLVDNIDLGINLIDADHTIVMANAAKDKHFNKAVGDLVGKKCFRVFEKRDTVCPHCPGDRTMATGQPAEIETGGVGDDGSPYNVRIRTFPVCGDDSTVTGFIEVAENITERKRMEQTLREHKEALQHSFFGTAEALSKVIEDRDPYTSGHSAGVAGLAEAMARVMGLSEEQITGIHIAGVLHDIGKMAVPVEILVKPGRLTDTEMSLIQIHPEAGHEILQGIDFPWPVAQATLQHHERMDGSGYPQGLKGDKIILEARILAVADVVDAMTHHRPYRPAFSVQDAMEEISNGRGRFYDPQVVDACLEVLEGKEAFTSSVYSMHSTSPKLRRGSTKSSALPTTTMIRSSGKR